MHSAFLLLLFTAAPTPPDTLVVCPREFRPALVEWEAFRREQGHEIVIIEPPTSASDLQVLIRSAAQGGRLKYMILIGDVPDPAQAAGRPHAPKVPTNYIPAEINMRWGSEPTIASDVPYCDIDSDDLPDIAVGRIPADSPDELATYLRKVIRYECEAAAHPPQRRLNVVAGRGGFGAVADAIIEAAGRHVIQQTVPPGYDVQHLVLTTAARPIGAAAAPTADNQTLAPPIRPPAADPRSQVHDQFREGCLAWIYLGHGLPTELDRIATPAGRQPILCVADVPHLRCSARIPLAVLVACYTGAFDASRDCLAEELALAGDGPIAVIAATRVTMPYGNTVLGCELLRACFDEQLPALGDILRQAQCRTLSPIENDSLRDSLDAVAQGISPPPVDLASERKEHVLMYHLLGDPLLRLHRAPAALVDAESTAIGARLK